MIANTLLFFVGASFQQSYAQTSLSCERVEINGDSTVIFPTQYCYSGSFSASGVVYEDYSFNYKCIGGQTYYFEYHGLTCNETDSYFNKSSAAMYDSYSEYCGLPKCDVVHLTLYYDLPAYECENATEKELSSLDQYNGAFLEGFCNAISAEQGLKFECDGDKAKVLTYNDYECKTGVNSTTIIDTSAYIHCNESVSTLVTGAALRAQCEIHSDDDKQLSSGAMIGIIVGAVIAVVVLIAVAVYCFVMQRRKKQEKYQKFINN